VVKNRKTACLLWSSKFKFSLLVTIVMSTACASSVSLLSYRNTILNQSAHIFALGYFLMDVVLHVHTKVMFYWNHTFLVGCFFGFYSRKPFSIGLVKKSWSILCISTKNGWNSVLLGNDNSINPSWLQLKWLIPIEQNLIVCKLNVCTYTPLIIFSSALKMRCFIKIIDTDLTWYCTG